MGKVFVTYSRDDSIFVDKLVTDLNNYTDLKLTFDKKILDDGDSFTNLFEELGTSDYLIVVLTKNSITSKWCKKELMIGIIKEIEETFGVIPLIPPDEQYDEIKKQMGVALNTALQDKIYSRFDSKTYNDALSSLVSSLNKSETSEGLYSDIFLEKNNPFWRIRAENFTDATTFVNLFEDPEKIHDQMISPKPIFVEGGRGSGKTMLLKSVRASYISSSTNSSIDSEIPYFGVYQRASRGTYSLFEESNTIDSSESTIIFMDQFILRLSQSILSELKYCIQNQKFRINCEVEKKISEITSKSLRLPNITTTFDSTEELIKEQISQISDYVGNKIRKMDITYKTKSLDHENLYFLCKKIIEVVPELKNSRICFLIDECENFNENQKIVLNTLVKFSDGTSYTFKNAAKKTGFNTYQTLEDQPLQEIHDFEKIDMDFDISSPKQRERFSNHVLKISEKIMKKAEFENCNIKEILEDRHEYFKINSKTIDGFTKNDIMNEIKSSYNNKEHWKKLTERELNDMFSRHGTAAEYKLLKTRPKSYAGFDDFVTFSSGNIRIFIELCGLAHILSVNDGIQPKFDKKISFKNQTKSIEIISEHHLWDIRGIPVIGRSIQKLINDMGEILRKKLFVHFHESESSLISILNPNSLILEINLPNCNKRYTLQEIMDVCIMYSIFHEHNTIQGRRAKSGFGILSQDYVLNRIYAQTLKISPRPMFSYSIDCNDLKKLLENSTQKNTKKQLMLKLKKSNKSKDMMPMTNFLNKKGT